MVRALARHARGRWFESCAAHFNYLRDEELKNDPTEGLEKRGRCSQVVARGGVLRWLR